MIENQGSAMLPQPTAGMKNTLIENAGLGSLQRQKPIAPDIELLREDQDPCGSPLLFDRLLFALIAMPILATVCLALLAGLGLLK